MSPECRSEMTGEFHTYPEACQAVIADYYCCFACNDPNKILFNYDALDPRVDCATKVDKLPLKLFTFTENPAT